MLSSLIVAALVGLCMGGPLDVSPHIRYGNINLMVDLILVDVNRKLPDAIPIPDIDGPFSMHDCFILGTEKGIHRDGDATMNKMKNIMQVAMTLKMKDIGLKCSYKYGIFRGTVQTTSSKLSVAAGFTWIIAKDQHPWLTEWRVTDLEPLESDISGLGWPLNKVAENTADAILNYFQNKFEDVIETQGKIAIQSILNTVVTP